MGNILNIFGGPAQVALYDSTNGVLFMGFHEEVGFDWDPLVHKLMDGNGLQYSRMAKLNVPIVESDPTKITAITARRGTKQTIYVVGMEMLLKLSNVYPALGLNRMFKGGEVHKITLEASTKIEADVENIINLLSSVRAGTNYGNFNTDTNTDDISDGWADVLTSLGGYSRTDLGGGDYRQNIVFDDSGQGFDCDIICPIDGPVKVTVSATITGIGAGTNYYKMGVVTKKADGTVLDSNLEAKTVANAASSRVSYSASFTPSPLVKFLTFRFYDDYSNGVGNIGINNAQMEFGDLTDYTEND